MTLSLVVLYQLSINHPAGMSLVIMDIPVGTRVLGPSISKGQVAPDFEPFAVTELSSTQLKSSFELMRAIPDHLI